MSSLPVAPSPRLPVAVSPRSRVVVSPRRPVAVSPRRLVSLLPVAPSPHLPVALLLAAALLLHAEPGDRWWQHVRYLADDKLEGRLTGSEGHRQAANYVAAQFEKLGLKPAGTSAYIQPVKFHTRRIVEKDSSLALVRDGRTEPLVLGEDAILSVRLDPAPAIDAPLVFVGYGLTVPEMKHDDLAGLDLGGKVVVYLSGGPSNIPGPLRSHYQSAGERNRALARAGAVGS